MSPHDASDPIDPEVDAELDADPALASVVLELESHSATQGWDRPAQLFALVDTASLVTFEPELAAHMGLDDSAAAGSFTAVEQDELPEGELEEILQVISWPDQVAGCAAVAERIVLPPEVEAESPEDPREALDYAVNHPLREEVRIAAGVTRAGATYCALRMRNHDDDQSVLAGVDLVPGLLELLQHTLTDGADGVPSPVVRIPDEDRSDDSPEGGR
jgi:hypothetical protein